LRPSVRRVDCVRMRCCFLIAAVVAHGILRLSL
jgi:hypothetical protein